jgi:hypothetical protein
MTGRKDPFFAVWLTFSTLTVFDALPGYLGQLPPLTGGFLWPSSGYNILRIVRWGEYAFFADDFLEKNLDTDRKEHGQEIWLWLSK